MGVIAVLASAVADQIAAGEVVERPASVVKELVENALDAGASRVDVDIVGGGVERLVVTDDGSGMDDDDAVLCFERHATSKLKVADDLRRIGSFGFRGEALAAISSVAKVTLTTKKRDKPAGFAVVVEGGRVVSVGEAGHAPGTRVDVRDLFFNVPARRKFLKTLRTEAGHIEDTLLSTALCRPDLGVRLVVDGKVVEIVCYPPANEAGDEDTFEVVGSGNIDIPQNANNTTVTFGDDTNGETIEGDLVIDGNNVAVYGNGVDETVLHGNVVLDGNNVRLRGLTIDGDLTLAKNNLAAVFVVVTGNVIITGNNSVFAGSAVFGDVTINGNNTIFVQNHIAGALTSPGTTEICEDNRAFDDANDDGVIGETELGDALSCN